MDEAERMVLAHEEGLSLADYDRRQLRDVEHGLNLGGHHTLPWQDCRACFSIMAGDRPDERRAARVRRDARREEAKRIAVFRMRAKAYHREGTLEIDDDAEVSLSDDGGAYVQAWLWLEETDADRAD